MYLKFLMKNFTLSLPSFLLLFFLSSSLPCFSRADITGLRRYAWVENSSRHLSCCVSWCMLACCLGLGVWTRGASHACSRPTLSYFPILGMLIVVISDVDSLEVTMENKKVSSVVLFNFVFHAEKCLGRKTRNFNENCYKISFRLPFAVARII